MARLSLGKRRLAFQVISITLRSSQINTRLTIFPTPFLAEHQVQSNHCEPARVR
jgi:hypothetical protein